MLTGMRQTLATALSTVDGVTGFTTRPKSSNPGDAWPVFGGMERDPGGTTNEFMVTWRLFVFLPSNDQAAADAWIDGHVEDLYAAIQPVAFIDRFAPVELTDTQRVLLIECRSE